MMQRERWRDVERELLPLMQNAYDALEPLQDVPLNIDCERYAELDDADVLHVLTLRDGGVLVGQCLVFCTNDLRHKGQKVAQTDHIWLEPQYRGQGIGAAFMRDVVAYVEGLGVLMFAAASRDVLDIRSKWQSVGFAPLETLMIRRMT